MLKIFPLSLLPVIILLFPAEILAADVSVNVSSRVSQSSNSVVFVQSSSQATTDVKIDNNGAVKTFHAEGNQNINWRSDDGKTQVRINQQTTPLPTPSITPAPTPKIKTGKQTKLNSVGFLQLIINFLEEKFK